MHAVSSLPLTAASRPAPARPGVLVVALRVAGAIAVLAVGAIHLQQFLGNGYSTVPVIGPLFALNFAGATVLGLALLAPVERLVPRRIAPLAVPALALAAAGLAAGSLVSLEIAEHGGLFGFVEHGYRTAIVLTIVADVATVVLLAPVVVEGARRARRAARA